VIVPVTAVAPETTALGAL
jgi:hypothetical protein